MKPVFETGDNRLDLELSLSPEPESRPVYSEDELEVEDLTTGAGLHAPQKKQNLLDQLDETLNGILKTADPGLQKRTSRGVSESSIDDLSFEMTQMTGELVCCECLIPTLTC